MLWPLAWPPSAVEVSGVYDKAPASTTDKAPTKSAARIQPQQADQVPALEHVRKPHDRIKSMEASVRRHRDCFQCVEPGNQSVARSRHWRRLFVLIATS